MSLNSFFQISVSIFCIIASVFMVIIFIWVVILRMQINKLIVKFGEIADVAKSTSIDVKEFIERTIAALEKFKESILTFEFIRKITSEVMGLIRNHNSNNTSKE